MASIAKPSARTASASQGSNLGSSIASAVSQRVKFYAQDGATRGSHTRRSWGHLVGRQRLTETKWTSSTVICDWGYSTFFLLSARRLDASENENAVREKIHDDRPAQRAVEPCGILPTKGAQERTCAPAVARPPRLPAGVRSARGPSSCSRRWLRDRAPRCPTLSDAASEETAATISGTVADDHDRALAGVTVEVIGPPRIAAVTDERGAYALELRARLDDGGFWAVRASRQGCRFSPPVAELTGLAHKTVVDFAGSGKSCVGDDAP